MKTLQCEEVYRSEYRNLAEARARIGEFLEEVYNQNACTRLSAIVRPPSSNAGSRRPCWRWSWHRRSYEFSEAWGNLSMRGGHDLAAVPPLIAVHESPAGYSWQVALQQSPLPLHQPELYCQSSTSPANASAANGEMSLN